MTQEQTLIPILKEFNKKLQREYKDRLIKIILFGSQARGDAKEDSDIDIMVVLKSPVSPGDEIIQMADIAVSLELKYHQMLSIIPVSEEDYIYRKSPLMDNIHREGIIL
ncbi:nucleotidyltransferase domain-containing protein [Crocosphaera sp. XPORK-15E]|uniref:nucleotidyltransferase domain-containing protein n=1 Tax=Crocosphaera sp. XPORK-15E TaxID=3110247 RepID=UPI002B20DA06|nr:nucleotidyltransferase domain-containing protein [Crocosphaera sp. XPORK-15E]MEA5532681.1 nucleotidyltransferase domain-containing protein [Crocosphaera sp. XPORK-15E]